VDDSRLDRLEQRLAEMDQRSSAMERMLETLVDRSRQAADVIMPTKTRSHLRAAGRENLLAIRSLLDFWADKLADSNDDSDAPADKSTREQIPID
jgi:type II secretory pathway component PulJ